MLNAEKFEKKIKELNYRFAMKDNILVCCDDVECGKCGFRNGSCAVNRIEWLLKEYKEPILDDIEKEYLSAVIKPFRKRIKSIKKTDYPSNSAFISIAMDKCEHIFLPVFELNSGMYQRMEINKEYTLEELGLRERLKGE